MKLKHLQFLVLPALSMYLLSACSPDTKELSDESLLTPEQFRHYIDEFNAGDEELYVNAIPNHGAWEFLSNNIPLFDCPDKELEKTYYFRWWTYRKHIKNTSDGYVITEFLPQVNWSGKHNTISCAAGHHFYEGRWLHDTQYLDNYARFWFRKGGSPRRYSFWSADAIYQYYLTTGDQDLMIDLLPDLIENYEQWEAGKKWGRNYYIGLNTDGLFSTIDDRDGMELSIGGHGKRPSINSYMFGDATAISKIALLAGEPAIAEDYREKANLLKGLVLDKLWDSSASFFKILSVDSSSLSDVRELIGYTPWYFNLPDKESDYEVAWAQISDSSGFNAPFGPTTAEQRDPQFEVSYGGHECKWNGPSWPYASSVTLTAMANVLNNYPQEVISKSDYFDLIQTYSKSHRRINDEGVTVPWIDENINPYTGEWLARAQLETYDPETGWSDKKGGKERGKDYNHSSFCDLIISGLVGLRPRSDNTLEVNPLVPENRWDWFCLDNILYHGKIITIVWDKTGKKYNTGKGFRVYSNGKLIGKSNRTKFLITKEI